MNRLWLVPAALLAACSSSPSTQVITGRIDPGYPTPVARVKATTSTIQSWHGNAELGDVAVAPDGTFRLEVPPMRDVHLILVTATGQSTVVFPRSAGGIDRMFQILANGSPIDLGMIRFVGDAASTPFTFKTADTQAECDDDGEDDNGQMCVDDDDSDHNQCGQDDDDDHADSDADHADDGDSSDAEHEDGDSDDGEHEDGDHDEDGQTDQDDGPDMGDSVAEHNFPADGCSDDDGSDDHADGDHHDDGEHDSDDGDD